RGRGRPPTVPHRLGGTWTDRPIPARYARHAGPAADPGDAVRTGTGDRCAPRRLRPGRRPWDTGARAGVWLRRYRQVRGGARTAQGARAAAWPLRVWEIRPV